jgi:protoporphyrinogen oxidase
MRMARRARRCAFPKVGGQQRAQQANCRQLVSWHDIFRFKSKLQCRGPNATFRFPAHGGTGGIWKAVHKTLPSERFQFNKTLVRVEGKKRVAHFADGTSVPYKSMISTMPLDELVDLIDEADDTLRETGRSLIFSTTHVIGVGIRGVLPSRIGDKCWL